MSDRRRRMWSARCVLCVLLAGVVCGQTACGQAAVAGPPAYLPSLTFDVASVREAPVADSYTVSGNLDIHHSGLRLQNFTVRNLLSAAYGVEGYQMDGLPQWDYPAMFTVVGKGDAAADETLATLSDRDALLEKRHMLQVLLAERVRLKTHVDVRQLTTSVLVVAKPGRLRSGSGAAPTAEDLKFWGDHPVPPLYQRSDGAGYDYVAHGAAMEDIVGMLRVQLQHPIVDRTGLTGRYDFVLRYQGATEHDRDPASTDPMPPLDQAIQDVLGLKVEAGKAPVQVLVIDHIEKPSAN